MDIVLYPDPRLRAKNAPIDVFDQELADLARQMFELMYQTKGVGLAAPQVGINCQLLVYNQEASDDQPDSEVVLCNPRMVHKAKNKVSGEEGCLSFPGIYAQVMRHETVTIEAEDLQGETFQMELDDWEARIFQHEFDHLEGILFVDRFTPVDKTRLRSSLRDLQAEYQQKLADS